MNTEILENENVENMIRNVIECSDIFLLQIINIQLNVINIIIVICISINIIKNSYPSPLKMTNVNK